MNIFFTVIALTTAALPALALRYLPFSKIVTHVQKKKLLIYYSLCFLIQFSILYILLKQHFTNITPSTYKLIIFIDSLFYVLINMIVLRNYFFQHLFVFGMQSGYSLFIHSLAAIILSMFGQNFPVYAQFGLQTLMYIILTSIIALPLFKYVKSTLTFKPSIKQHSFWYTIWLVPVLAVYSNVIITTINPQWINSWQQFVSRLFMGAALVLAWKGINSDLSSHDKILHLKSTNDLLFLQNESIQNQAQILNENNKKISILKHDMRHHLTLLSSLLKDENFTEAKQLISQINTAMQSTESIVFCKNNSINSVLLVYYTKAQENKIDFISKIDLSETLPWNCNDIAILFSNALENAVLASMKQDIDNRRINITTRYSDKKLAINIKNRYDGKILFDEFGFPITKKIDHGIGVQSMLTIVDKYHGNVSFTHVRGWFTMTILFSDYFIEKNKMIY